MWVSVLVRNCSTSASGSAQMRETSDFPDPGIHTEGADQVVHRPRGHAVHVGLHDHRVQGPIDPPATLEQRREERPGAQLRDLRLDVSDRGRDRLRAVAVAVGRAALGALVAVGADLRRGFGLDQRLQAGPHQLGEHGLRIGGVKPLVVV